MGGRERERERKREKERERESGGEAERKKGTRDTRKRARTHTLSSHTHNACVYAYVHIYFYTSSLATYTPTHSFMHMLLGCTTLPPSFPPPYTHTLVLACLQDRLNLSFFDPEYYNTFEETGTVEMIGQLHGLKKDGRNEFTLPDRLPQGWAQFSKEKLIQLFIACPPEIQKKLHGHPKMWENPENYRGLDNDPQVLGIGVIEVLFGVGLLSFTSRGRSLAWQCTTYH
jgi:hypothetical protein